MTGLGGEREKNKNKRCMSLFRKKVGLCSRYWHSLETAMLLGGATETGSYVSERSEGVPGSPGESFCGALGAAKLGPADQNQQRTGAEGKGTPWEPQAWAVRRKEKGGCCQKSPPDPIVRNKSPYHTHSLLSPQRSRLPA